MVGASTAANWSGWRDSRGNLREKSNHKGMIWGVYVRPAYRKLGVARAIFRTLLERAKVQERLEQIC